MRLGPISGATVIVRNLEEALVGYVDQLGLVPVDRDRLPRQRALDMGDAALADAPRASLRADVDTAPWLTLIEMPGAPLTTAFARRGWVALRLMVLDVDAVAARLDRLYWRVMSAPAMREDDSYGVRVAGAHGEVLDLTAGLRPSGPRQWPVARCPVDRIAGAVLGARDCATVLGFYEGLGLSDRWRRTAENPVCEPLPGRNAGEVCAQAIGQLRGCHAIEILQLPGLPAADSTLRSGIRMLSFSRSDAAGRLLVAKSDPSARILAGPEGEALELL